MYFMDMLCLVKTILYYLAFRLLNFFFAISNEAINIFGQTSLCSYMSRTNY